MRGHKAAREDVTLRGAAGEHIAILGPNKRSRSSAWTATLACKLKPSSLAQRGVCAPIHALRIDLVTQPRQAPPSIGAIDGSTRYGRRVQPGQKRLIPAQAIRLFWIALGPRPRRATRLVIRSANDAVS